MNTPIYLDNNATTSLDPAVKEVLDLFPSHPYNPSSIHTLGKEAKKHLSAAREIISEVLHVPKDTLVFTSGGTESINMLIRGLYPNHGTILSTTIEHSCIHETLLDLKNMGVCIDYVPVSLLGAPTVEAIEGAIHQNTSLMVFSAVYSETGAKLDLSKVAQLALKHHIPLIIDGVALLGKEAFKIPDGITAMGFSSHKLHGPKGVGLVYISNQANCKPLLLGGHQEKGLRAGTENLEGIWGFAKAIELLKTRLAVATAHMERLRNLFESLLFDNLEHIEINGEGARICNTSNIYFSDIDAETLLIALDRLGVYASAGSACSSGALEPSRVLINMGYSRKRAKSSIRFSLCRYSTQQEIEDAAKIIIDCVKKLRS